MLFGSMDQRPLFATWVTMVLAGLLALLVILVLLWLALLRPTVRSTAREAVAEPLAQTNAAVNDLGARQWANPDLPTDPKVIAERAGAGDAAGGATTPGPAGGTAAGAIATEFGEPEDARLVATGTGTTSDSYRVDDGKVFSVTDLVFQNPAGDTGTVVLLRGRDVLLTGNLANFRDLDYHFVAPILAYERTEITLRVECANTGGRACSVSVSMLGFLKAT